MKRKLLLLVLCAASLFFAKANDGGDSKKADIIGGVYNHNSKKPLSSVTVTVYSAAKKEKTVHTNDAGVYVFDDLKAGTYKFVFEKDGYKRVTRESVVVQPERGLHLNIEMYEHASFEFVPGPFHFSEF